MICVSSSRYSRKYLFLSLIIISVVISTLFLLHFDYLITNRQKVEENLRNVSSHENSPPQGLIPELMLEKNVHFCFSSPFGSSISDSTDNNIENWYKQKPYSRIILSNGTLSAEENSHPLFNTLFKLSKLLRSLQIEAVIIDPHILFCMLSTEHQNVLLKRGFRLKNNNVIEHVMTLGIFYKHAVNVEKERTLDILKENGFQLDFLKSPTLNWMKYGMAATHGDNSITSHIFFTYKACVIHAVVFHQRSQYLWHASLPVLPNQYISLVENLYFVEDSAYENFTASSLGLKSHILKDFSVPSNPAQFLLQMESSKFLECNKTIVDIFNSQTFPDIAQNHSSFSVTEFNKILVEALQELKSQFDPLFIRFWIWSGTMLGWYRQCDVIPYTGDVDFGAWTADVDNLNQTMQLFLGNKRLELKQKMGLIDEALEFNLRIHHLRVDVFFLQNESNGTWYAGHRPSKGYYFKYHHPRFSLCSAELLEHKVLVPCETEQVIATEYGTDWIRPVESWNYESSIKNRGPNIYWNKTLLKEVNQEF